MRPRFTHPLWIHIPAVAAIVVLFVTLANAGPLPGEVPIHFGPDGQPDNYGSPLTAFALFGGLSVGFLLLSVWLDELWARQEREKTFNFLTLFDELVVSSLAGMSLGYLHMIQQGKEVFALPTQELLYFAVPVVGVAVLLEKLRPFTPHEEPVAAEDTSALRRELELRMESGASLVYWESQNPAYVRILAIAVAVVMFAGAASNWLVAPVIAILEVGLGIVMGLMYGGLRTLVTKDGITVRFGIPGIRVLKLSPSDIMSVELCAFRPLKDFGGYGIRRNSKMKAYFMRGHRGTLLGTTAGKKHLIGSDHPERLAEVIRAVAGLGSAPPPGKR